MKIRRMIAEGMTLREIQEKVSLYAMRTVMKEEAAKGPGAVVRTSRRLNISRTTLYQWINCSKMEHSEKLVCSNQTQELDSGERN